MFFGVVKSLSRLEYVDEGISLCVLGKFNLNVIRVRGFDLVNSLTEIFEHLALGFVGGL